MPTIASLSAVAVPLLPNGPVEYTTGYQNQLNNILRLYFQQLGGNVNNIVGDMGGRYLEFPYGAFADRTTQTAAVINTAYAVTFDTTTAAKGAALDPGNTSHITVDAKGVYSLNITLQAHSATGAEHSIWVWVRVNGTDVADTTTHTLLRSTTHEYTVERNAFLTLAVGDYVQVMWAVDNTAITLTPEAATAFAPAVPSAVVSLNFMSTTAD